MNDDRHYRACRQGAASGLGLTVSELRGGKAGRAHGHMARGAPETGRTQAVTCDDSGSHAVRTVTRNPLTVRVPSSWLTAGSYWGRSCRQGGRGYPPDALFQIRGQWRAQRTQ